MLDDGKKYEIYKFKECSDKTWLSMLDLEKTVINNFSNERMLNAYNNIADAIKSNTPLNSSGYSAVKSIELIEEVYKNNLYGKGQLINMLIIITGPLLLFFILLLAPIYK